MFAILPGLDIPSPPITPLLLRKVKEGNETFNTVMPVRDP